MADNLKQLLLSRSDWFANEIMRGIRNSQYPNITPAQSRLLTHMAGQPTSMAELARRMGISRQAVHKTIGELVRLDILTLQEDPDRGNAKLVMYTPKGLSVNRAGAQIIKQAENNIAQHLGESELETLKALLSRDWN